MALITYRALLSGIKVLAFKRHGAVKLKTERELAVRDVTCGDRADQQGVQFHQGAEGGLAVSAAGSASAQPTGGVPQLQPVIRAPLKEDQAVGQQQRLNL